MYLHCPGRDSQQATLTLCVHVLLVLHGYFTRRYTQGSHSLCSILSSCGTHVFEPKLLKHSKDLAVNLPAVLAGCYAHTSESAPVLP